MSAQQPTSIEQVTLREVPVKGFGDVKRYEVVANGLVYGEVYSYSGTTVKPFAGKQYGRTVKVSDWHVEGSFVPRGSDKTKNIRSSGYGLNKTRKAAVADLLSYPNLVTKEA